MFYALFMNFGNFIFVVGSCSVFCMLVDFWSLLVISFVNLTIPFCIISKSLSFLLMFSNTAPSCSEITMYTFTSRFCPNLQQRLIAWNTCSKLSDKPTKTMFLQLCQLSPMPAICGLVTRRFILPSAKSSIAFSLCLAVSLPLTSTDSSIDSVNSFDSSLRSHHIKNCSSVELTNSAAFSTLSCKLSRLACLRSINVCANVGTISFSFGLPSTINSVIFKGGRSYAPSSYPKSLGFVIMTAQLLTHSQNLSSACPLSLHFCVSPASCTKNIDNISVLLITLTNSA